MLSKKFRTSTRFAVVIISTWERLLRPMVILVSLDIPRTPAVRQIVFVFFYSLFHFASLVRYWAFSPLVEIVKRALEPSATCWPPGCLRLQQLANGIFKFFIPPRSRPNLGVQLAP
ncbi:hypothetical protein M514_15769 [Trichuris suis]|uniref:Uncharacterized protein n=1 Tax=Trichuris suis TaxID=68888 RepID=A0A085NRH1_9BILA|nr:hypothetical protein M514_15769 [Trichuris suis]